MHRCLHAAGAVLLGLMTAQVIAVVHVYASNADLYQTLVLIRDAGYLMVPNRQIMPRLQEFSPAFLGGLFFTLTTGAGLSLLSLSAAWLWDRLFHRRRPFLILCLALWAGSLIGLNLRSLSVITSLYFLLPPPLVFVATLRWLPSKSAKRAWRKSTFHLLPVVLLAVLWGSQMHGRLFVDLRDHLLLSTSVGSKINDFYYTYTLYPAEALKPLHQKLLKTADLGGVQQRPVAQALERVLLAHDYCPVRDAPNPDLKVEQKEASLLLVHRGGAVLETTLQEFLSRPAVVLMDLSLKADRDSIFRRFTFCSLLIGQPLALYLLLHALLCLPLRLFLNPGRSMGLASLLCLFFGLAVFALFQHQRVGRVEKDDVDKALSSANWHKRVAGLRTVEDLRLEISQYTAFQRLKKSPHIPERYWLVRALAVSRDPGTYQDLLAFLDDPHPNVVSMAFYALGERGERNAVKEIVDRIETSTHWYNQWYAYKALRGLGWKQNRSTRKP